jgi:SecD/SecF fusion protein
MVRDLGIEDEQQRQPAGARASNRPVGGRRARSRAEQQETQPPQDGDDKPKKPRNRRHGRPR